MTPLSQWNLERYRPLLRLQVRQMQLNPRLRARFGSSDVVQEALLRACAHIDDFRGTTEEERLKWLQQILANAVKDMIRKETAGKRDPALERSLDAAVAESSARLGAFLAADQPPPGEQAARAELLLRLTAAIDQLTDDQRDVVIQRDLLGLPVAAIAEQMGRTEKSVAGLLLRGRQRLRELLSAYQRDAHVP